MESDINFFVLSNQIKMPEGPEVRLFEDYLNRYIGSEVCILHDNYSDILVPNTTYKVRYVCAYGKKLFISIDNENGQYLLVVSFSMMGHWRISREGKKRPKPKHSSLSFNSNGRDFHFIANPDWKFKAKIEIFKNKSSRRYIRENVIGADIFEVTLEEWLRIWTEVQKRCKKRISALLLEQNIVSGIGNYIRADMMYLAGVHPNTGVKEVTVKNFTDMYHGMKKIINEAYEAGGYNGKNFKNPIEEKTKYRSYVYQQKEDSEGNPVEAIKDGGRSVYYCPAKQSLKIQVCTN